MKGIDRAGGRILGDVQNLSLLSAFEINSLHVPSRGGVFLSEGLSFASSISHSNVDLHDSSIPQIPTHNVHPMNFSTLSASSPLHSVLNSFSLTGDFSRPKDTSQGIVRSLSEDLPRHENAFLGAAGSLSQGSPRHENTSQDAALSQGLLKHASQGAARSLSQGYNDFSRILYGSLPWRGNLSSSSSSPSSPHVDPLSRNGSTLSSYSDAGSVSSALHNLLISDSSHGKSDLSSQVSRQHDVLGLSSLVYHTPNDHLQPFVPPRDDDGLVRHILSLLPPGYQGHIPPIGPFRGPFFGDQSSGSQDHCFYESVYIPQSGETLRVRPNKYKEIQFDAE